MNRKSPKSFRLRKEIAAIFAFSVITFAQPTKSTGALSERWRATALSSFPGGNEASSIAFDHEGNIIVTGKTASGGIGENYYTAKYNSINGELIWSAEYNGTGNEGDAPSSLAIDSQNNVIVTGSSTGSATEVHCVTIKYSAGNGNVIWTNRLVPGASTYGNALAIDSEDNVYVAGFQQSLDGPDLLTMKLNGVSGSKIWSRTYNGEQNSSDIANTLLIAPDGNIIVGGGIKPWIWICRLCRKATKR